MNIVHVTKGVMRDIDTLILSSAAMLLLITASQSEELDFDTAPQLIKHHGYPVEIHSVVTTDGYILTLHRIPRSRLKLRGKSPSDHDSAPVNENSKTDVYTSQEINDIVRYKSHYVNNRIDDSGTVYNFPMKGLPIENYFNPANYEEVVEQNIFNDVFRKRIAKDIPESLNLPSNTSPKPAILLQHGVLASSLDWVLTGPEKALGFKLADSGYDVWLGNLRGTFPSRLHLNFTTQQPEYWDYSWHEIGLYDLSAMIDHVLNTTGQRDLHFIGHSMGATIAVVLLSEKPEYNEKVKISVLLAPVVRLRHNTSVFRHSSPMWKALQKVTRYSGMHDFPPDPKSLHRNLEPMCREKYIGQGICASILHTVAGYAGNINNTLLPILFGHYPSQTSVKTLSHFLQGMNSGNFSKYDYEDDQNVIKYNQSRPPEYVVSRITTPTAIFYGDSDPFTDPQDISWLEGELPNLIRSFLVPSESFSHLSFLWSVDVDTVLYDPILRLIARYARQG